MISASHLPSVAFKNKSMVEQSGKAGCFRCCKVFGPKEVAHHTDGGQTCVCPNCGHDCVVGDASGFEVSEENLQKASKVIFG